MKYVFKYLIWPIITTIIIVICIFWYIICNILYFIWDFKFISWNKYYYRKIYNDDPKSEWYFEWESDDNPWITYKHFLNFDF